MENELKWHDTNRHGNGEVLIRSRINQAGNKEMASDQFGSGGGFSTDFNQTNAKWQAAT